MIGASAVAARPLKPQLHDFRIRILLAAPGVLVTQRARGFGFRRVPTAAIRIHRLAVPVTGARMPAS
jgi:hypothetical protein